MFTSYQKLRVLRPVTSQNGWRSPGCDKQYKPWHACRVNWLDFQSRNEYALWIRFFYAAGRQRLVHGSILELVYGGPSLLTKRGNVATNVVMLLFDSIYGLRINSNTLLCLTHHVFVLSAFILGSRKMTSAVRCEWPLWRTNSLTLLSHTPGASSGPICTSPYLWLGKLPANIGQHG